MAFNREAAKQAGYTDQEIDSYLAGKQKSPGFQLSDLLPIGGSLLGGFGGSLIAPGAGTLAGFAAGGAGGEALRQKVQGKKFSPGRIVTEGALGLIGGPLGKGLGLGARLLGKGAFRFGLGPGGGQAVELGIKAGGKKEVKEQLFREGGGIIPKLQEQLSSLLEGKVGPNLQNLKTLIQTQAANPRVTGIQGTGEAEELARNTISKLIDYTGLLNPAETHKVALSALDVLKGALQTTAKPTFQSPTATKVTPELAGRLSGIIRGLIETSSGQPKQVAKLNELMAAGGQIGENISRPVSAFKQLGIPIGAASLPALLGFFFGNPLLGLAGGVGVGALSSTKAMTALGSLLASRGVGGLLQGLGQVPPRIYNAINPPE